MKPRPKRLVLVGLPGSGKTTLAAHVVAHVPGALKVTQDECGRGGFAAMLCDPATLAAPLVVIDRCNLTRAQRAELAGDPTCWVVVLQTSVDDCICRVRQRPPHPTLGPARAAEVITSMAASFEPVSDAERFGAVFVLNSAEDVDSFLESNLGLPPIEGSTSSSASGRALHKFPRTQHLTDLGSATRDDLVMDPQALAEFLSKPVIIEEKIDGANLGISIDPVTYEVLFQNRSHFVNAASATQFKRLGHWLAQNRESLFDIIEPGRHVLFGEWMAARHSIPYDSLPGYFVAFDLLDTVDGIFYSRRRLEQSLASTSIPLIRIVSEEVPKSLERLVALANSPSAYYPGPVEGVVVRICNDDQGCTVTRGKIVRQNFLAPSTDSTGAVRHWSSRVMEENKLAPAT